MMIIRLLFWTGQVGVDPLQHLLVYVAGRNEQECTDMVCLS